MTAGFIIALIVALGLARRVVSDYERLRLIAEAEHELRGPLQAIALVAPDHCHAELERMRVALADLAAARAGRRADADEEPIRLDRLVWRAATASDLAARRVGGGVHLDWSAGPVTVTANRGRLAQALSNLLANAVEHGGGHVRVVGRQTRRGVRIEVRDSGRGHGLTIAAKAVRDSGGKISASTAGAGTAVAIELPVDANGAVADADGAAPHPPAPHPPAPHPPAPHPRFVAPVDSGDAADADPPAAA